ncbi:MAG: glucokinase [Solirubrobacteraceae bacterium]|nr:glucokinase [Solirubrobacteraceae bacterium]
MTRLVGVDVGGTKVAVAVLEDGRLGTARVRATETASPDELVDQLTEAIEEQLPADAVGIGVPSVVDFAKGTARSSVNIPLEGVPLRTILRKRLGIPVYVDNDATVAAVAEAHGPDAKVDVRHLVMLTIGTGVGGGIVIDGRVYRGATGGAAELGHIIIGAHLDDGAPAPEGFPQPGSLERLASGRALDRLAAAHGLKDGPGAVEAARHGDPNGLECLRILGERLGIGIANIVNSLEPDVVVVGGGAGSAAGELLLHAARETAQQFILRGVGTKTEIRTARYGKEAGVLGAALMAGQELVVEQRTGEPDPG